jgi:hypothetical protein
MGRVTLSLGHQQGDGDDSYRVTELKNEMLRMFSLYFNSARCVYVRLMGNRKCTI